MVVRALVGTFSGFITRVVLLGILIGHGFCFMKRGTCSESALHLLNGGYRLSAGNQIASFSCNSGFYLYGKAQIICFGSSWSSPTPRCISNTCTKIPSTNTLRVVQEYEGSMLRFSCAALYRLQGASMMVCDGTNWSENVPQCISWTPPTSCDFETEDICGWVNHETDDRDWTRHSGTTPTKRTGPEFDHTLGPSGEGHYMYYETSSPARTGHIAALMSPVYPASYSGRCFDFWYHILGEGDIGDLEVSVMTENQTLADLQPQFTVATSMGPDWQYSYITVTPMAKDFQIVFLARRGSGYRSDFAVDDIAFRNCSEAQITTPTTTIRTTTLSTTTTTVPVTTTVVVTTPSITVASTTTARKPSTTAKTTIKPTSAKVVTSSPVVTTRPPKQTTTAAKTSADGKPVTTPRINPSVDPKSIKTKSQTQQHESSQLVYILLGVGIVVAVVIVVVVFWACYRKRKFRERSGTMSSVNPLYTAMTNDEQAVAIDGSRYHNLT